jgi:acyl-CoA thioester hydrolase
LKYSDVAIIETEFVNNPAAKIHFRYKIFCMSDGSLSATGETIQVFLDKNSNLSSIILLILKTGKRKMVY